jgi:hypothetical protein
MTTETVTNTIYSLTASMPGCLPDSQDVYVDLASARAAMPALIQSWADGWEFVYQNGVEVPNEYWEVVQGDDWADLTIARYSSILIRINPVEVDWDWEDGEYRAY